MLYSEMRQNGGMGCEGQETAANDDKMLKTSWRRSLRIETLAVTYIDFLFLQSTSLAPFLKGFASEEAKFAPWSSVS